MGILYPKKEEIMSTKPIPTEGELYLINNLRELLDDTFEIFFQPFINGDNPDVIILKKNGGVLIIEVKDWDLSNYIVDTECRFRLKKNNVPIKSPINQVCRYRKSMIELHLPILEEKSLLKKNVTQVIQTAVYFHKETSGTLEHIKNSTTRNMNILGRDSITKSGLEALLRVTRLDGRSIYFDDSLYNEVKRVLQPSFQLYGDRINIVLDKKQKELAKSKQGYTKIKGVAGSGKTIVLAERAANCYKRTQGKILILTYNITIKNYIEERIGLSLQKNGISRMVRKEFVITNYHQFINSQANNYGIDIKLDSYSNVDLFKNYDLTYDMFDGIFIDEVQDFEYEWLKILKENFLKKDSEFVLFGDEKQNIYKRELDEQKLCKTNIIGRWNELSKCYRLEEKTAIMAKKFQNSFLSKMYHIDAFEVAYEQNLLSDSNVKYEKLSRPINYSYIVDQIMTFVKKNNINNNDIAIIAPKIETIRQIEGIIKKKYKMNSTIMHETEEEYHNIVCNDDESKHKSKLEALRRARKCNFRMNDGKLKVSTIHSFKGWEIQTLILLYDDGECGVENLYASITRAINNIYIFNLDTMQYHKFFNEMQKQLQ